MRSSKPGSPAAIRTSGSAINDQCTEGSCTINNVLRIVLLLCFATLSFAAEPIIDNERVTVWDVTSPLPPAGHAFVAVSLTKKGTAVLGHKGDTPGKAGERTIVIELKDHKVPPLPNNTGYPNAFPRPHVKKLIEN